MGRSADYSKEKCAIAAAVDLIGEPWTLLIVRNAFLGHSRFEQWQKSLGVARNVLAARLKHLVAIGVMEAVPYSRRPLRHEYVLTAKGKALKGVLVALYGWGREYIYDGEYPFYELVHDDCAGQLSSVPKCTSCGGMLDGDSVLKVRVEDDGLTLAQLYQKKEIMSG